MKSSVIRPPRWLLEQLLRELDQFDRRLRAIDDTAEQYKHEVNDDDEPT